jgi:GT2 family glycosyltransferase/glycosyltransferase involved in cell wall biosynthesis
MSLPLDFCPKKYRDMNPDLFDLDDQLLAIHYITKGRAEKRRYNYTEGYDLKSYKEENLLNDMSDEDARVHLSLNNLKSKNILYFSPEAPNFDQSSGGNRLLEILKILVGLDYNIYFFVNDSINTKYINMLRDLGIKTFEAPHKNVLQELKKSNINFNFAFFSWWNAGEEHIESVKKLYPGIKIIVDSVDVHWVREERGGLFSQDRKEREKKTYLSSDVLLVVTEEDKQNVIKECGNIKIKILSNIHREESKKFKDGKDIIFVGGFKHTPNVHAAIKAFNIYNRFIVETGSEAKFYIVGNDPPEEIKALHNGTNVIVTGYVEDLKPYYLKSKVLLAPLTWGAGIKGKICQAVMNRVPILTSTIGSEGFGFENFEDCFIARSDREFINSLKIVYSLPEKILENITKNAFLKVDNITSVDNATVILKSVLEKQPHVVVSILTYNNNLLLDSCLKSIQEKTEHPNYTVIVTDNACSKETEKIVSSYNNITYIGNKKNDYFIKPNNLIIQNYTDSDILLLNDDVEIKSKCWLTHLQEAAYSAGYIACSGGKSVSPNGMLLEAGAQLFNDGTGLNIGMSENPDDPEYNQQYYTGYVSGCVLYMRRDVINKIGILDEEYYPMYYEDSDWQYRAHINGYKSIYEPKCSFIHRLGSTSGQRVVDWMEVNKKKFLIKFKKHDIENYNIMERVFPVANIFTTK